MRRRRFLGAAAGAALTVAGCGRGGSGGGGGDLRLVATEYGAAPGVTSTERYWHDVVESFRGEPEGEDIGVEISVVRRNDANIEVSRMVAEDDAPDIAQVMSFADLAADGRLHTAGELLTLPQLADFVPALARAGEASSTQYGLPFASLTWRLFYNTSLFRHAGLDPERPPRDWAELRAAAGALRAAGVPVPFALPLGHQEAYSEAALWMLCGGGAMTDVIGDYTIDSAENHAAFAWLRDELVAPGLTGGDPPSSVSRSEAFSAFTDGQAAMAMGSPLLARQADEADIPFATATPPGRHEPLHSTLGEASWLLALNERGNRERIRTFLRYVFGSGQVTSFSEYYGLLPVTVPATEALRATGDPAYLVPFLDDLPSATFHPVSKISWSGVAAAIAESVGRAVQPHGDITAILGELQANAAAADREALEARE